MSQVAYVTLRDDGTYIVVLGGRTHKFSAPDVDTARDDASAMLSDHARRRGSLRVHVDEPTGSWTLHVDHDGTITDATQGVPLASELPAHTDSLESRLFASSEPTTLPGRSRRLSRHRRASAAVALTLVLAAGGGLAAVGVNGDTDETDPSPRAPVDPAQGWTDDPAWVSPKTHRAENGQPPVLALGDTITTALTTSDGPALTGIRASDGKRLWTRTLNSPLTAPPQVTTYNGRAVIAAATANELLVWPQTEAASNDDPKSWTFTEAGVTPVPHSPLPLLANEATATAMTLKDDKLVRRTLPGGAEPVAALEDGIVIALNEHGHWWALQTESNHRPPNMLQPPAWGAKIQSVLGVAGDTLLVSWTRTQNTRLVAAYDVTKGMTPLWQTIVPKTPAPDEMQTAPDHSWVIVATTALDVSTGRARSLPPDWKTLRITNKTAWSKAHVAGKLRPAIKTPDPITDPDGIPLATAPKGQGIVAAGDRIYALTADTTHAHDDGTTVTQSPSASATTGPDLEAKKKNKKTTPTKKTNKTTPTKKTKKTKKTTSTSTPNKSTWKSRSS